MQNCSPEVFFAWYHNDLVVRYEMVRLMLTVDDVDMASFNHPAGDDPIPVWERALSDLVKLAHDVWCSEGNYNVDVNAAMH